MKKGGTKVARPIPAGTKQTGWYYNHDLGRTIHAKTGAHNMAEHRQEKRFQAEDRNRDTTDHRRSIKGASARQMMALQAGATPPTSPGTKISKQKRRKAFADAALRAKADARQRAIEMNQVTSNWLVNEGSGLDF